MKKLLSLLLFSLHLSAMDSSNATHPNAQAYTILILNQIEKACEKQNLEQIKILLPQISSDSVDANGRTVIFYAVMNNCIQITEEMIQGYSVNINVQDKYGDTPLHYAAWLSSSKIVKALLAAGAYVDKQNHEGETPLFLAVKLYQGPGNPVIEKLIAAKANIYLENNYGYSPYKIAIKESPYRKQLLELLKKDEAEPAVLPYRV